MCRFSRVLVFSILVLFSVPKTHAEGVRVVCVEKVWCDIASQIGGSRIQTTVLMKTAGVDPHDMTLTPSMGRLAAGADIFVFNGGTYDDWARPLIVDGTTVLNVAEITAWKPGEDPHFFFDIRAVQTFARVLKTLLSRKYPETGADFVERLLKFENDLGKVRQQAENMKSRHPDVSIAAVEPVGMALLQRAGLFMVDPGFAFSVMRHAIPSPQDVAMIDIALREHKVRMLLLNPTIHSPQIDRLTQQARASGIPLLSIGETLPPGISWQTWLSDVLTQAENVLDAAAH